MSDTCIFNVPVPLKKPLILIKNPK